MVHWSISLKAGMVYVMLGRSEELYDVFIRGQFDIKSIKVSVDPNLESIDMRKRAINNPLNLNSWMANENGFKFICMNVRSLRKHHQDVTKDARILKADVIGFCETWIEQSDDGNDLDIENYHTIFSNHGCGKGVVMYGKKEICCKKSTEKFQLIATVISNPLPTIQQVCVITIYLSNGFQMQLVMEEVEEIFSKYRHIGGQHIILQGDLNFDALECTAPLYEWLKESKFHQLVKEPTHIDGGALDQVYVSRSIFNMTKYQIHALHFSYHDAVCVTMKNLK